MWFKSLLIKTRGLRMEFFVKEENRAVLGAFLKDCEKSDLSLKSKIAKRKRLAIIREFIKLIYGSPDEWDRYCTFNIKDIGDEFLEGFRVGIQDDAFDINSSYIMSYRLLREFAFHGTFNEDTNQNLSLLIALVQMDIQEVSKIGNVMDSEFLTKLDWVNNNMIAVIFKGIVNGPSIDLIKNFHSKVEEAEKLKNQWNEDIQEKEAEVDKLKERLDEYENAFNFVGLYKGFDEIAGRKINEARGLFWSLFLMSVLILAPLIFSLCNSILAPEGASVMGLGVLAAMLPLI